jgi:hypothetical protein
MSTTTTTPGSAPTLAPISTSAPAHPLESPSLESRATETAPEAGGAVMGGSNTPPEPMVSPLSSYQHPNLDPDSSLG